MKASLIIDGALIRLVNYESRLKEICDKFDVDYRDIFTKRKTKLESNARMCCIWFLVNKKASPHSLAGLFNKSMKDILHSIDTIDHSVRFYPEYRFLLNYI